MCSVWMEQNTEWNIPQKFCDLPSRDFLFFFCSLFDCVQTHHPHLGTAAEVLCSSKLSKFSWQSVLVWLKVCYEGWTSMDTPEQWVGTMYISYIKTVGQGFNCAKYLKIIKMYRFIVLSCYIYDLVLNCRFLLKNSDTCIWCGKCISTDG